MLPHHPIKAWRFFEHKSLKELSSEVGASTSYLSELENRKKPMPIKLALKIAAHTGLSLDQMYELPAADSSPKSGG